MLVGSYVVDGLKHPSWRLRNPVLRRFGNKLMVSTWAPFTRGGPVLAALLCQGLQNSPPCLASNFEQ